MTDKLIATVVPRTISKQGQDIKVAATLVLRPGTIDDPETTNDSQLFEHWPTIIQSLFAAPDAVKAELGVTDSAGKFKSTVGELVLSTKLTTHPDISKDPGFGGLKFAKIATIWRDLLQDHDGAMTGLRTALLDATDDEHPYCDVQQKKAAPPDNAGPLDKAAPPKIAAPPNIVGMPRTELAQQITMARAQALIARVKGRTPSRQAFLGEGAYLQRPWARAATANERLALDSITREPDTDVAGFTPDGTPIVFAAVKLPAEKFEFDPHRYWEDYKKEHPNHPEPDEGQWSKIKDALVTQRQDKDEIYKKTLATQQQLASVIHGAEVGLSHGDPKSLQIIRDQRAKHKTLHEAIAAVGNNENNVACELLQLHDAATLEDYGNVPNSNSHTKKNGSNGELDLTADDARRRWFALLGFPALQHVFLLSVDVEFLFQGKEFNDLVDAAATTPDFVRNKHPASFLLIRLHVDDNEPVLANIKFSGHWTLAKAPQPVPPQPDCFMPATLEELLECCGAGNAPTSARNLRERGTIDQFDGVIDLEAAAVSDGDSSLRFSVETVDIHAATESDMRRDAAMANAADLSLTDGTALPPIPEVTAAAAVERKLRTAGLQLLDQWRGSVVVKQFSRSLSVAGQSEETLILDADDLAVGYRLDVGFRTSATTTKLTWACLTNREVKYSLPGGAHALDMAVDAMLAGPGVDVRKRRVELDGSVLAMPTRLLQNANGDKTGFAESVLAAWQGDPLGLEAYEQKVGVCPGGLALNVDFDLLSGNNDERPPKLRFGVPYWLGARTVFLGGVSLPLQEASQLTAKTLYEAGLSDGMLLPRQDQLRRFLRQEWIDPPMVAVPWANIVSELGIATKIVAEEPAKSVAGKLTKPVAAKTPTAPVAAKSSDKYCRGLDGETIVVRLPTPIQASPDEEPDDEWRFKPATSQRAVCAPGVDLTFAHLHGVFDADVNSTKKFGLAGVDYDLGRGGFPSISPQASIDENSIVYMRTGTDQPAASGIAVFRPRSAKFAQPVRANELYYPDPAARSLVIGLRYPWTTDTYLSGTPIVVPLYGGGNTGVPRRDYPDAMPVLITIKAIAAGADGRLTKYQQLEKRAGGKSIRLAPIDEKKLPTGHNAAIEVIIKLAPAEDFSLDIWALPDLNQLVQWFDGPESVAFCCASTKFDEVPDPATERQKLRKAMPGKISDKAYPSPSQTIRRNDAVVSSEAVAHTAAALHAALSVKPIPELSAVRSMRAVHAVEQPPFVPKPVGQKPSEIRFLRVDETKRSEIVTQPVEDWHSWPRTCDSPSATDVLAGGDIMIDRAVHESIELRVKAVSPNGRPIDNPLLGRTPEDRSRGLWPQKPTEPSKPDDSGLRRRKNSFTRRLYGFDVDDQGRVTFYPDDIVFNKWLLQPDCHLAQETVSLVQLTAESEQPAPSASQQQGAASAQLPNPVPANGQKTQTNAGNGRRSAQRYFSDGTARRLKTYFAATSRTARLIPERSTYPDLVQQDRDKERLFAYEKDAEGNPVMTSTIIRSIVRPLALPPKHILPAFVWTNLSDAVTGARSINRRTRIRIPFDRPAMTSGEDERIGIVLWPPNILGASIKPGTTAGPLPVWTETDLTVGKVRRAEPLETNESHDKLFDLQALGGQIESAQNGKSWRPGYFSDEDLGPGGAYISRWGADPIHDAGEMTWLMHPRAFRDVLDWTETALDSIATENQDSGILWPEEKRYVPRLVENVLMPIPGDDPSKPKTQSDNGREDEHPKEPDFMLVSLLTYAPRFDVESETWYVDVEIDPGTAPDPFLRLGLVRYQPHANRRIQVSYPVSEWIQVVGYCREVTVDRDNECVTVAVKGPVLAKNTSEAPLTVVRASLIERRVSEYGIAYERPARTLIDGKLGEPIEQVSYANAPSDELIWKGAFNLPSKDDSDDTVSYAIFIEECYRMRRATFDQEPVKQEPPHTQRDDPAYWSDSGPRFAVRIDL